MSFTVLGKVPLSILLFAAIACVYVLARIYSILSHERPWPDFPVATLDDLGPKQSWQKDAKKLVEHGLRKYEGRPFQIITGTGPRIVFPHQYADEFKSHPALSFSKAVSPEFFPGYPGFQGVTVQTHSTNGKDIAGSLLLDTVRVRLTQSLGLVTQDLVEEAQAALADIFGEEEVWHEFTVKQAMLELVARMSSRVFMGEEVSRNRRWLDITKSYTLDVFAAAAEMKAVPAISRPVVHWFLPHCKKIRQECQDAEHIMSAEIQRRKSAAEQALAAGEKPPKTHDAVGWMVEMSKGDKVYDLVAGQLSLSLAAIHTTTEAMSQLVLDLCEHPEVIEPLRQEICETLTVHGWCRTALYRMRLLDSFMKESQRFHRAGVILNRYAEENVDTSCGITIPKGSRILIEAPFFTPEVFQDPYKFDAYRFLHMREAEGGNGWQYTTASKEFMAFGLGQHSCPGRFFVANEIKIALCHMLLRYDWQFLDGQARPADIQRAGAITVDPRAKVQVRRRVEELDLTGPVK